MCFPRKAGLGRYNATRAQWAKAYRHARVRQRRGEAPDAATCGIDWKAALIVAYERDEHADPLNTPLEGRLASKRLIDDIVGKPTERTAA